MRKLSIVAFAMVGVQASAEPSLNELWSKPARATYFSSKSPEQLEACISFEYLNVLVPLHAKGATYLTHGDLRGFVTALRISDDGGRRRIEIATKRLAGSAIDRAIERCL